METMQELQGALWSARSQALSWLGERGEWSEIDLPAELCRTRTERAGITTEHLTRAFESPSFSYARLSLIWNERSTLIVNFAAFPRGRSSMPLIQAELVVVKSRLVLGIFDLNDLALPHGLDGNLRPAALESWRVRYPELKPAHERPNWTEAVVSPEAVYSRAACPGAPESALACMEDLLAWTAAAEDQASRLPERPDEEARQRALRVGAARRASLEANPSKAFLGTMFGADWTGRFVSEVLYPEVIGSV